VKKNATNRKQSFIEAFRKATQEHTHNYSRWDDRLQTSVEEPFPYPIPGGKYTIDENFGKSEICIRCKKCWTDDLIAVAKKVAPKFKAKVSSYLSVGGFGTAYNFFTVNL
jgi:hypothetical protein